MRKKTRRGGQKLQATIVPGSPVTPTSISSRSTFGTPAQSPSIPPLYFDDTGARAPSTVHARNTKRGRVCDLNSPLPPPTANATLSLKMTSCENGYFNVISFYLLSWIRRHYQRTRHAQTVNKQMVTYGAKTALHIHSFVNHAACYCTRPYHSIFLRGGTMVSLAKHHCMLKDISFISGMRVIHVQGSHCQRWMIV